MLVVEDQKTWVDHEISISGFDLLYILTFIVALLGSVVTSTARLSILG